MNHCLKARSRWLRKQFKRVKGGGLFRGTVLKSHEGEDERSGQSPAFATGESTLGKSEGGGQIEAVVSALGTES